MLIRYKQGKDGPDAVARVYSREENNIDSSMVDRSAVTVIRRLTDAGYESYLVGGAVRDMILGRRPKDFDIATAASPRQVHKLFYNSRIIGRRFRLVHITFGKQIIEVSTFMPLLRRGCCCSLRSYCLQKLLQPALLRLWHLPLRQRCSLQLGASLLH